MDLEPQQVGNLEKLQKIADESDDDVPQLSADTLKALQEFYAENENSAEDIDEDWVSE